jgi:hypothetical protein
MITWMMQVKATTLLNQWVKVLPDSSIGPSSPRVHPK